VVATARKNCRMHPEFPQRIHELVERAKETRRKGIHGVDPEALTKQQLIEPLLEALGYDLQDDVKHEFHILGDQCDYLLETRRPLLFVEAKSLLDKSKDLFDGHREQVLRYLRNYRISPEQVAMQKPVTWLLLTNFAQIISSPIRWVRKPRPLSKRPSIFRPKTSSVSILTRKPSSLPGSIFGCDS